MGGLVQPIGKGLEALEGRHQRRIDLRNDPLCPRSCRIDDRCRVEIAATGIDDFEVEMRSRPLGVAGITHVRDDLTRRDSSTPLDPGSEGLLEPVGAVIGSGGVVVDVDVDVFPTIVVGQIQDVAPCRIVSHPRDHTIGSRHQGSHLGTEHVDADVAATAAAAGSPGIGPSDRVDRLHVNRQRDLGYEHRPGRAGVSPGANPRERGGQHQGDCGARAATHPPLPSTRGAIDDEPHIPLRHTTVTV